MDTVHLLCGSCGQMMGVSVQHLGAQVHCPHCKAVVQVPAAKGPAPGQEPTVLITAAESRDGESIFAGPEPTDDIFDQASRQKLEIPVPAPPPAPVRPFAPDLTLDATEHFVSPTISAMAAPALAPVHNLVTEHPAPAAPMLLPAPVDEAELPAPPSRRVEKKRNWPAILLIFLIPYCVIVTVFLILQYLQRTDPLNYLRTLPDPVKDKGAPRKISQIKHDLPLAADMKVALNKTIQVGILELTPLKVQLKNRDLVLHLRAKNISKNFIFNPIADEYLKYTERSMDSGRPYTFLDSKIQRLYGGFAEWQQKDRVADGEIGPGEEETILVTTFPKYQNDIERIMQSPEPLTWRVQVRRGLVLVEGELISATTVVGVEFTPKAIEKEG